MDNFNLRKYLAEGRLLKESNNTVRVYISDLDKEVDIDISGATKNQKGLIDYAIEIEEFPTIEDAEGMFGQLMDINSEEEVAYYYEFDRGFEDDQEDVWKLAMLAYRDGKVLDSHEPSQVTYDGEDFDDLVDDDDLESLGIISEEFLFVSSDGDKVYKDEKGLYYFDDYKGEKLYYHPDYPPYEIVSGNYGQKYKRYPDGDTIRISGPVDDDDITNSADLSWEDFQKKFPKVKDNNLAGEVYSIMQQQNGFDDYEDEDIISFMNSASTWTDAEDVANYFDEPASDLGRLIASYYQEESGYENKPDQWDNYLDRLFHQTERQGDDIDG